jgi:hypothetical protein
MRGRGAEKAFFRLAVGGEGAEGWGLDRLQKGGGSGERGQGEGGREREGGGVKTKRDRKGHTEKHLEESEKQATLADD